ncbi:MAG: hypothetical protein EKK57_07260 [Proteobacteria bacterium]|nr:MAG: hypothetical protein EKK57_07260 [Pseudomonadota bacterium]
MQNGTAVVIHGHTLAIYRPTPNFEAIKVKRFVVLRASILRGATFGAHLDEIDYLNNSDTNFRLATRKDFDDFRITYNAEWIVSE